jgi:protein SCO1/2
VSPRLRVGLVAIALVALGGIIAATIAARSDDDGPAAKVTDISGATGPVPPFKGAVRPKGARAPNFTLRDQDGGLVRLSALRGNTVVLSPMYTICRDTCPLVAQQIKAALLDLSRAERHKVVAFALSVDPAHDTPARAKHFLVSRRVNRYLDFLLGSRAELKPIWRGFGFAPQTVTHEHNSYVVLIDRRGFQRVGFAVGFLTPESRSQVLRRRVRESEKARATAVGILTL